MTQKKVSLTQAQKDSIGLIYFSTKNALEACQSLLVDKTLPTIIRHNFIRMWELKLRLIKNEMDKSLGCNESFAEQIRDSDTQGLNAVIAGYIAAAPEIRDEIEAVFNQIKAA